MIQRTVTVQQGAAQTWPKFGKRLHGIEREPAICFHKGKLFGVEQCPMFAD